MGLGYEEKHGNMYNCKPGRSQDVSDNTHRCIFVKPVESLS